MNDDAAAPVAVPPLDLVSDQPSFVPEPQFSPPPPLVMPPVISTTPPKVTPPSFAPETLKKVLGGGTPLTQETQIRQTIYPGMPTQQQGGNWASEMPGTQKRYQGCVQYLAQIYGSPDHAEFTLEVHRTGPPMYNGQRLPFGPIERMPVVPYPDAYERIKGLHGGGAYKLRVLSSDGSQVHQMLFSIDMVMTPPKIPNTNGFFPSAPFGENPLGAVAGEAGNDISKLRTEELRYRAEESAVLSKARLDDTRRTIDRKEQNERDAEERKLRAPMEEARHTVDVLRAEVREQQHQSDLRFTQMMSSIEKMTMAMAQGGQNGGKEVMAMFMQMIAAMQQSTTQMMTALLQKPAGNSDVAEAMKMSNESNKALVQMAIQAGTSGAQRSEKLVEMLLTKQIESPDSAVKNALEIRKATRDETLELVHMMNDMREPADQVINPDGGFFGNLGNVLLTGLNSLVSGAAKGGGMKAVQAIASALNKPGQTQFSQTELSGLAGRMAAQLPAQQRPALPMAMPAQQPQAPAIYQPDGPVMQPRPVAQPQRPRRPIFDKTYDVVEDAPVASGQVLHPAVPQWQQPPVAEVVEEIVEEGAVIEAVPVIAPITASEHDDRLSELVSEAMETCIEDLKSGRAEHDWVDFAMGKWGNFLKELAAAPDDSARVEMIQKRADPQVFNELLRYLMDAAQPQHYQRFIENLHLLLEEAGKEAVVAA